MCRSAKSGRRKYVDPIVRKEGEVPVDRAGSPWENDHRESCAGNEYLGRELFYTLREAQVLIEWWRQHDNTVRRHSALGYRPPAPAARAFPTLPRSRSLYWH